MNPYRMRRGGAVSTDSPAAGNANRTPGTEHDRALILRRGWGRGQALHAQGWQRSRGLHPARYPGQMSFTRITVRPDQMGGVPCLRGLRIPVATVVGMVADGMSEADIVDTYPDLETDDVREAMQFAAEAVRERELPLAASG